jgi:hypothetical protein
LYIWTKINNSKDITNKEKWRREESEEEGTKIGRKKEIWSFVTMLSYKLIKMSDIFHRLIFGERTIVFRKLVLFPSSG